MAMTGRSAPTYVSIYCAEPSHEADPWYVATYIRSFYPELGEAGEWSWTTADRYYKGGRETSIKLAGIVRAQLAGDRYVSQDDFWKDPDVFTAGDPSRSSDSLKCARCGLSLSRRSDQVDGFLDRLADANIRELSLRSVVATLI